jgi:cell wall-associated NlpC family hydrolase
LIRTGVAAILSLALTACAGTAPRSRSAPGPLNAPAGSVPANPYALTRPSTDLGAIIADTARSVLGQPYRFGGAAPGGFDCSGLVVYAANGAGIRMPRTASEQQRFGRPVGRGEVRAGDLVFMHLARKELHVGIAIDGLRFIHAPATGGTIRIDSLAAPPYTRGFTGARRIIAAP